MFVSPYTLIGQVPPPGAGEAQGLLAQAANPLSPSVNVDRMETIAAQLDGVDQATANALRQAAALARKERSELPCDAPPCPYGPVGAPKNVPKNGPKNMQRRPEVKPPGAPNPRGAAAQTYDLYLAEYNGAANLSQLCTLKEGFEYAATAVLRDPAGPIAADVISSNPNTKASTVRVLRDNGKPETLEVPSALLAPKQPPVAGWNAGHWGFRGMPPMPMAPWGMGSVGQRRMGPMGRMGQVATSPAPAVFLDQVWPVRTITAQPPAVKRLGKSPRPFPRAVCHNTSFRGRVISCMLGDTPTHRPGESRFPQPARIVEPGTIVEVLNTTGSSAPDARGSFTYLNMTQVRTSDGRTGWIPTEHLRRL